MELVRTLSSFSTELEWLEGLPIAAAQHGKPAVDAVAKTLLSKSQIQQAWKAVDERRSRLVWLRGTFGSSRELLELAIILTDRGLNEVERRVWTVGEPDAVKSSPLSLLDVSTQALAFLREHCTRGQCPIAGSALQRDLADLQRALPEVCSFFERASIDVGASGVQRYADLIGLGLLPSPKKTLKQFEFEHRQEVNGSAAARAIDDLESSIVALGWAKNNLIEPPKARKLVLAGMAVYNLLLVIATVSVIVQAAGRSGA
eukprot:4920486-Prymnesium_polylepis.2